MNLKEKIKFTLNSNLPFVFYRKPNSKYVKLIIQDNSNLNYLNDFSKKGFIFAPFDDTEKSIFFPLDQCKSFEFQDVDLKLEFSNFKFQVSNTEKTDHLNLVNKGINFIKNNGTPKIVLSRKETFVKKDINLIQTFLRLLSNYQTAFIYLWFHPKVGLWLGATPETLVQIKNNSFKTMALAGTQEYQGTTDVVWGNKEVEEQKFVSKYIVSQLEKLEINCKSSNAYTVKAGNLLHLRSDILGRVTSKNETELIIKTLHPTPAVCGLPKEKAKQFILINETYNREFYTGYLGELNFEYSRKKNRRNVENQAYKFTNKITDLFVNLRCMQVINTEINLYIGGGITKDSNAENEFLETVVKSKTIKKCL